MKTKLIASLLALVLVGTSQSFATEGSHSVSAGAVAVDTVLVRPACFVATVVGSAFFVLALPFAAMSKSVQQTAHALVVKPAEATFKRPLGEFEDLQYE